MRHPHAVDESEQQDRMRKMEREYERRQQEILLEAEAAVRAREEALNQVWQIFGFLLLYLYLFLLWERKGGGAKPGLTNIWISTRNPEYMKSSLDLMKCFLKFLKDIFHNSLYQQMKWLSLETQELGRLRDELERQKAAHQVCWRLLANQSF